MTSFWCERALVGDHITSGVLVDTETGVITSVEIGTPCPPAAERLAGTVVPGLANAHSHAFHRAMRGHSERGRGSFWTWREEMYALAGALDPAMMFRLARATYAEMVLAGVTVVGEFHYLHHGPGGVPYSDPNEMTLALAAAAREAGLHLVVLDACYLAGGFDKELNEVQRRFCDGSADAWVERVGSPGDVAGFSLGAAVHSVRAVPAGDIAVVARHAREVGMVLHAHVSEQRAENQECLAATNLTPVELLATNGVLGGNFTAVHATHLTDNDVSLLGSHHCTVCMCPTTERDLADGIGPTTALAAAGVKFSLGSDSHAVIDLFEEARGLENNERLATNARGNHSTADLLRAACSDGHASVGRALGGRIAVGSPADLVAVRTDSVRTAGTDPSTLEALVFAATAADVSTVVSAGRVVVRDGTHTSLDVARELTESIAAARAAAA